MFLKTDMVVSSICIMSLLRIVWLQKWDLTDMTYTVTPGAIYSFLEPALGVINACLPTMMPALNRLSRKRDAERRKKSQGARTESSNISSQGRRRPSAVRDIHHGAFSRLDDDIPLTNIYVGSNLARNFDEGNNITVTRAWEVGRIGQSSGNTSPAAG